MNLANLIKICSLKDPKYNLRKIWFEFAFFIIQKRSWLSLSKKNVGSNQYKLAYFSTICNSKNRIKNYILK